MSKKHVLILTNPLNHEGGVVNYYNLFFRNFHSDTIGLRHHTIGSRAYLFYRPVLKRILYPFYYLIDVLKYVFLLLFDRRIKIIQVSPSLIPVPLIRDGFLVILAKILGKKVIVFYRGWKLPTLNTIKERAFLRRMFNLVFQKNTLQIVLAEAFKKDLISLKPTKKGHIYVTKTAIEKKNIVKGVKRKKEDPIKVLFLGRVQDLKGINELIDAICVLKKRDTLQNFIFTIVGHEDRVGYIEELKSKLKKHAISEEAVSFPGRIVGEEKFQLYASNDIYVLPSYTEGCPNSVLEALASGLFCITTPVGALSDLIEPPKNGLLVKEKSVEDIVDALQYVNSNHDFNKFREINSETYSELFDINLITKKFETLYIDINE